VRSPSWTLASRSDDPLSLPRLAVAASSSWTFAIFKLVNVLADSNETSLTVGHESADPLQLSKADMWTIACRAWTLAMPHLSRIRGLTHLSRGL
jgi:hypothetical protein